MTTRLKNPATGASVASERKTLTFSAWVKKCKNGADMTIFEGRYDGNYFAHLIMDDLDNIRIRQYAGGSSDFYLKTDAKYRDTNGWYHIVMAIDTTQATASNRIKLYVNGEQITSFSTETYPSQNLNTYFGMTSGGDGYPSYIGDEGAGNYPWVGCMSDVYGVGGTAYDADTFGETDANGVWKPNTNPSITYGTGVAGNFHLKFDDTSNFGRNYATGFTSNSWTVDTGTMTNTKDNPSNVFATFNPLARNASNTYANGNTTYDYSNNYQKSTVSTLSTNNVKIYSEFKILRNSTMHLGIAGDTYISDGRTVTDTSASHTYDIRGHTGTIVLQTVGGNANIYADGSDTGSDVDFTTTTNDIVMIAFDPTTKKIWFGKNGTWSNSGDPSNGTNPSYTYSGTATSDFCFAVGCENSSSGGISANFGNGYFGTTAVSSAGTNASGIGIFEYDVPTGYTALSTKGLNE